MNMHYEKNIPTTPIVPPTPDVPKPDVPAQKSYLYVGVVEYGDSGISAMSDITPATIAQL